MKNWKQFVALLSRFVLLYLVLFVALPFVVSAQWLHSSESVLALIGMLSVFVLIEALVFRVRLADWITCVVGFAATVLIGNHGFYSIGLRPIGFDGLNTVYSWPIALMHVGYVFVLLTGLYALVGCILDRIVQRTGNADSTISKTRMK